MSVEGKYQAWLSQQRQRSPSPEFADRVMAEVLQHATPIAPSYLVLLSLWVDRSRVRRLAACCGAFVIGALPLVYLAYLSKAFVF